LKGRTGVLRDGSLRKGGGRLEKKGEVAGNDPSFLKKKKDQRERKKRGRNLALTVSGEKKKGEMTRVRREKYAWKFPPSIHGKKNEHANEEKGNRSPSLCAKKPKNEKHLFTKKRK